MSQTENDKTYHITIVGGGMVGLSLAILLSQQTRLQITLIERFAFTDLPHSQSSFDERSTALSAGSVDILREMGCLSSISNYYEKIETIHVSDRGHFTGVALVARDFNVDALGYVIENCHLGEALLKQLRDTHINFKTASVDKALPVKNGFSLSLNCDGILENLETDLLVIADGAQSSLRQQLGIRHSEKTYGQIAMIANVALEKPHHNIAYERFTDEGPIALLPLPPHQGQERAALVWTLPADQQKTYEQNTEATLIEQLHQRFGYRAGRIIAMGQRHFYPLTLIEAEEQVRSNVVILGNAAHFLHPVAGQGFNLALRDCHQLHHVIAEALNHSNTSPGHYQQLKRYIERQQFDQYKTIGITDNLVTLFSTQKHIPAIVRQLGLMGLNATPGAKTLFGKMMMGQANV